MRDYKQPTVKERLNPPLRKDMRRTIANVLTVVLIGAIGYLGYQWLIATPTENNTPQVDVNAARIIPLQLPPLKPTAPPPPIAPPVNLVPGER